MKNRRRDPSTTIPLELREFLCFAIYSANHAFNRVYQPLLGDLGLTYPQFIALVLLWEEDKSNGCAVWPKALSAIEYPGAMLNGWKHVKRRRDSADERRVRINLTEDGRKLHLGASDIVRRVRHATCLPNKQIEERWSRSTHCEKHLEAIVRPEDETYKERAIPARPSRIAGDCHVPAPDRPRQGGAP